MNMDDDLLIFVSDEQSEESVRVWPLFAIGGIALLAIGALIVVMYVRA